MKTLEYKNRKAFSVSIEKIMVIAIAIVAVGILAAFGGDLIGTASVVETLDLSKQSLYAEQEFVSVTVKNSGTTSITGIQAYVLIDDADGSVNTNSVNCQTGSEKALISIDTSRDGTELAPGESVTINGNLYTAGTITDGDVINAIDIGCGVTAAPGITGTGTNTNDISDRTEYIIQVDGISEGGETISTTTTVRAR